MTKPANSKQLVHVTVSTAVVAAVDLIAAQQFTMRSEFTRRAVVHALENEGCCPVRPVPLNPRKRCSETSWARPLAISAVP